MENDAEFWGIKLPVLAEPYNVIEGYCAELLMICNLQANPVGEISVGIFISASVICVISEVEREDPDNEPIVPPIKFADPFFTIENCPASISFIFTLTK